MKYQYILNGEIKFETDDVYEYMKYVQSNYQLNQSVLFNLLLKAEGYIANMSVN
jgi:hypothetical protein